MGSATRLHLIVDQINANDVVLDVGCVQHSAGKESQTSWLHKRLREKAKSVLGLDFLRDEVEKLRDKGYNVVYGDAENLSLDSKFDAIVVGELIEHLGNPGRMLEGAVSHLKTNGRLILTTPNPWFAHRFFEAFTGDVMCNFEHTMWLDRRTLRQLLERYGLEIKELRLIPHEIGAYSLATMWKPLWRRRVSYWVSYLLYRLGFETLGAQSIFVVAAPRRELTSEP